MFCTKCGKNIEKFAFCPYCGEKAAADDDNNGLSGKESVEIITDETICTDEEEKEGSVKEKEMAADSKYDSSPSEPNSESVDEEQELKEEPSDDRSENTIETSHSRNIRRIIAVTSVAIIIILSIIAVAASFADSDKKSTGSDYDYDYNDYKTTTYNSTLSSDTIELIATTALRSKLNEETIYGVKLSQKYNLGSTRYRIASEVETNYGYLVRGTFTLYDYYGNMSSYYNCTFDVKIDMDSYGYDYDCTVTIK